MKALVFDFGGTIDTGGLHWFEKFWSLYSSIGIVIDRTVFREAFKYSEQQMSLIDSRKSNFVETYTRKISFQVEYLKKQDMLSLIDDVPQFSQNFAKLCRSEVEKHIKSIKELLSELKGQYKMILVSNYYGNLQVVCREFGIEKYFDHFIDSTLVGIRKPDPAIFKLVLSKAKIRAKDAFVIGDSYGNDITPAHSLGCKTVWLKVKGWQDDSDRSSADHTISELEELRFIVCSDNKSSENSN
ncbi:MAG: HAD family hydrolase [Clostridiales bacterium]